MPGPNEWMREVMLRISQLPYTKIFRVNVGMAWTSSQKPIKKGRDVLLKDARPFKTGLPKGFHDLFGVHTVTITEDMVGQRIGMIFSIECKTGSGRPTKEQMNFKKMIEQHGGISVVVRPGDQLEEMFNDRHRTDDN